MAATKRVPRLLDGPAYLKKAQRVADWVEEFFQKSESTKWPTFREVSYACNVSQANIAEMCNEGIHGLMETQWNVSPSDPLRDHFVEICN